MRVITKRIYEEAIPTDGFRVLVDRLWPRGVSKEKADLDLWAKDIAPSNELREDFHHGKLDYAQFSTAYAKELNDNSATPEFLNTLKSKGQICILTAAKDVEHSHVPVIENYIESHLPSVKIEKYSG